MATNCDAELALYKKMKALFLMPEAGKGYCVEVLPDGSYKKIEFSNLENRHEILGDLRRRESPHAIFCYLEETPLLGFCGKFLYIEENAKTGQIEWFSEEFIKEPDPVQVRIEMLRLVEMLQKKIIPKIHSC